MEDDLQRDLRVCVGRLHVPAAIVVTHDLTAALDHELADPAAIDSELAAGVPLLNSVVITPMVDEDASFFPHVAASLPLESCVCRDALERLQRHCDAAVVADELRIVVTVLSY